jgi:hypothetical protein
MKKTILFAGALFAALSFAPKASAVTVTYADADTIGKALNTPNASYTGSFNFVSDDGTPKFNAYLWSEGSYVYSALGFNPATQSAISASFKFYFKDSDNDGENATVDILAPLTKENFIGYVDLEGGGSIGVLGSINATGAVSYTVTSTSGTFYLAGAYAKIVATVPEGGATLAMLGGSMLGMVALRKRLSSKK